MKQRYEFIRNYKSQIIPGFKSFEETLKWLSEKVDIIEIPLSSFTNFFHFLYSFCLHFYNVLGYFL